MMTLENAIREVVERALTDALAKVHSSDIQALDAEAAGKRLGVSAKVVREMIANRELRGWKLHGETGEWRVSSKEIERFIRDREDSA